MKVLGNKDGEGRKYSYKQLTDLLKRRFGPGQQAENHMMELRHRKQGPKESLQELGQAVRELTALSYPEFDDDGRERLAKGHFSDAVEDQAIREGIYLEQGPKPCMRPFRWLLPWRIT